MGTEKIEQGSQKAPLITLVGVEDIQNPHLRDLVQELKKEQETLRCYGIGYADHKDTASPNYRRYKDSD